jgi:type VI protein secretion system component Hcp
MRGCLVLSVLALSAVSLAMPICAEAKSNSSIAKATAKGTHIKEGQITTKKTNGGVTGGPVKPKGKAGTIRDIAGESRDSKHLGEIHLEGGKDPPPPPPPPPPK